MSAQPHATSIPTDSAAGPQSAAYAGNGSQTVKMSRTIHINISGSLVSIFPFPFA